MDVFYFTNWIVKDPVWLVVLIGVLSLTLQFVGIENIKRWIRELFSKKQESPPEEPPEEPKHWLYVKPKLPRTQIRFRL